ncbi:hypothetical protein PHLCEN_2v11640 [Hermanssonia centrifuga]|uniref:Protein kinase domain-containing protein n=1 Tax=Hermanssonia centrifuga TaxID=98765 RepID=A0A2R6NJE4_9APHY|nr:hypothetical protein PHLCEN_2v11640 [Hermanssonia centrifuga]
MDFRAATPPPDPNRNCQTLTDTPAVRKQTHSFEFLVGPLDRQRESVLIDTDQAILVSPEWFLDNLMPKVNEGLIDRVVSKLKSGRRPYIVGDRWRGFPNDPIHSSNNEATTFMPLVTIAKMVARIGREEGKTSLVQYESNPHCAPHSTCRNNLTRPDGYFILRSRPGTHWIDIAVTAEFKKAKGMSDIADNIKKIVWSIMHCNRDDARRRFCFGFTIENTNIRYWYYNHSALCVTDGFNFITDHRRLVHFFLAILFATEEELGWDTSIKRVANQLGALDITVRSETGEESVFRTIRTISDFRADGLLGKGTRVWEVVHVVDGKMVGPHCVLKDVWIEADRPREGQTLLSIRNSRSSLRFKRQIDRHFLTVLCHGDVFVQSRDGNSQADDTLLIMMHGQDIPEDYPVFDLRPPPEPRIPSDPSKTAVGHHRAMEKVHVFPKPPVKITARRHYRIVFNEVCRALHDETSLQLIFKALSEACFAIRLMHRNGWVHRDISIGNILIDADNHARLADLEHAKYMDDNSVHTIRTGTSDFMAVEVDYGEYQFQTGIDFHQHLAPEVPPPDNLDEISSSSRAGSEEPSEPLPEPPQASTTVGAVPVDIEQIDSASKQPVFFRHNAFHDLESLFWIFVFLFTNREIVVHDHDEAELERRVKQRQLAATLFHNQEARRKFLSADSRKAELDCLHRSVRQVGMALEQWRLKLTAGYKKAETEIFSISIDSADYLGAYLMDEIIRIKNSRTLANIILRPRDYDEDNVEDNESDRSQSEVVRILTETVTPTMVRRRTLSSMTEADESSIFTANVVVKRPRLS